MRSFYVLWTNESGLKCWSGPYESFEDCLSSTPMRDRKAHAFVAMSSAMVRG